MSVKPGLVVWEAGCRHTPFPLFTFQVGFTNVKLHLQSNPVRGRAAVMLRFRQDRGVNITPLSIQQTSARRKGAQDGQLMIGLEAERNAMPLAGVFVLTSGSLTFLTKAYLADTLGFSSL